MFKCFCSHKKNKEFNDFSIQCSLEKPSIILKKNNSIQLINPLNQSIYFQKEFNSKIIETKYINSINKIIICLSNKIITLQNNSLETIETKEIQNDEILCMDTDKRIMKYKTMFYIGYKSGRIDVFVWRPPYSIFCIHTVYCFRPIYNIISKLDNNTTSIYGNFSKWGGNMYELIPLK